MKKAIMTLGVILAWAIPSLAATHDGVQLWENGPLWAKTNIGANSPTESGYYFWWGDTLGYKWQNNQWVASDGSKTGFSFSDGNCPTAGKTLAQLQSAGYVDADGNLVRAYDAAAKQWGDDWRMPKSSEIRNLIDLCAWSWSTVNGVVGYTVTGKGLYSGNSIFLPAAGWGMTTTIYDTSVHGFYRSTTVGTSLGTAKRLCFSSTGYVNDELYFPWGYTIRPVKALSASRASSAVATLDTRTGTRVVASKESIAYDAAWGEASSGSLTVNGSAVSGLSSKGTYAWTPNTSATNYWKLAYKAGTANYSATFHDLTKYTITYANVKGAANTNPTQYNILDSITFAALPNVAGYVFNGWTPAKIAAGGFGAKTVTAQWTPITYAVKFNANGGTGTMANESFTYDTAKALTANAFMRTGYTFQGWATSASGAKVYTNQQSVKNLTTTANGTVNLYAVWTANAYSVKFNANGGTGSMSSLACTYDKNATLTANAFTRAGYVFLGWMTSANGTTVAYKDGLQIKNLSAQANATINLYAKWTDKWYVNAATGNDANEGASADQAFKTIQCAIDKTVPGMTIIVADGTYAPINSNDRAITIQSVNGAANTIIDGGYPTATNRCVYAGSYVWATNTVIRGFTLQNGCTIPSEGGGAGVAGGTLYDCVIQSNRGMRGGGAACSTLYRCKIMDNYSTGNGGGMISATAYDCEIVNNSCATNGAGAHGGVLNNCTVISNRTEQAGGGAFGTTLKNCVLEANTARVYGGGAYGGSLNGCMVTNNVAYERGGGIYGTVATACTLVGNEAYISGGGAYAATCRECKFEGNKATSNGGGAYECQSYACVFKDNVSGQNGGAAFRGQLVNCLVYGNRASSGNGGGVINVVARNCTIYGNVCSGRGGGTYSGSVDDRPVGTNFNCVVFGNVASQNVEIDTTVPSFNCCTTDPHFMRPGAGDFRLRYDSPCIDAGNNAYNTQTTDFAGNPRVVNGKIDIGAYEYSTALDTNFTVKVTNGTGGAIYYEGDTVTIAAEDRSPRYAFLRWTGDVSVIANANSMTNTFPMPKRNLAFTAEYDDMQQYLVIDLSGGKDAAEYPVSNLTEIPAGGWTDEYKTSKLVLRRIDPGTFTMGSPEGENGRQDDENPHQVTLTHSYYIGVFELTQRQWELVMGNRPSAFSNTVAYATRPVERVSFKQIRGAELGSYWPQMNTVDATSFMGKLREKTGRLFDLPTEAQWEYACRAGTTTALNSGKNLTSAFGVDANMDEVGRYYYNSGAYDASYDLSDTDVKGTAKVGSYLPNAWGLFDMHGNVGEICLDWYRKTNADAETDPIGPEAGSVRSTRGGTWGNFAYLCRSAVRGDWFASKPSALSDGKGFRPVVNFADFSRKQVVNLQASDGTDPDGVRLTWTVVPGADVYRVMRSATSDVSDATVVAWPTTNTYLSVEATTNVCWYWVRARVDGVYRTFSASDSGYRPEFPLTVANGTGNTNCFANTSVPIKANAAKTGYSFKAWTGTAADVALVANKSAASTTFKMPARAVTLTATYQANAYSVKFNANGGTGTMANEAFTYDTAKTLTANAFTRTGYTFQGWATSATGAKAYSNQQSVKNLTATANGVVNLYAVWTPNAYTVKFNANGGTGTMSNESFTYDVAKALTANAFSRTGYTFQGWATSAAGAKVYANQQSVSNLTATASGTFNLYAVWKANSYTVKFDANGGTGSAMADQSFTYGTAQKLSNGSYTRTGYTFLGWSADKNAKSATYANGASVSNLATSGTKTLYAVWRANTYKIRFQPNGATGTMADEAVPYDTTTNLTANAFAKAGYGFVGWCAAGETVVGYTNKQQVVNLATDEGAVVTLTAMWTDRWYVDAATGDDANEGVSAEQAFKTIQHAIDRSVDGMSIIVADGTYAPINAGNKSIIILSVNGAEKTIIDGGYPTETNRCVYAGATDYKTNTVIRGFTIQNGCTVGFVSDVNGAGVVGGTLYDCVVRNNHGGQVGGGAAHSAMFNCLVANNETVHGGGGVYNGQLTNCRIINNTGANGGGAYGSVLSSCVISNNVASYSGGGANNSTIHSSVLTDNQCSIDREGYGGGAYHCQLDNCLVSGNRTGKSRVAGVSLSTCRNCTIYGNAGMGAHAWLVDGLPGGTNYNCIVYGNDGLTQIDTRMASFNCFTRDPLFVDAAKGDFRLQGASPCIDMGNNKYAVGETDVRGNARIQNGVVDIGAIEYTLPRELGNVPVEGTDVAVPVEWLGTYGYVDEDATPATLQKVMKETGANGHKLWQSWVAGLDPWKPDSQLHAEISIDKGEVKVSWTPDLSDVEPKRHYTLSGKTNLTDVAWVLPTNSEHRFFNVTVMMVEPGLAKEVAATEGASAKDVSVSWRAVDRALGYHVYRSTVDDFSRASLIASVTGTEYVDTAAVPGTRYYYWIVSVANGGEWRTSERVTGYRKIGVPRQVAASDGTSTDWITVTWQAVEGAVSYRVLRATTGSEEDAVEVGTSPGTSWTDQAAATGVTYTYWVIAVGAGISSEPSAPDAGYLRLAAPGSVRASNGGYADRITVTWDVVNAATHYCVYRSTSTSGTKTPVSGWQTTRTYSDTTAEAGQTYYYFVRAAADAEGLNASSYSAGAVGSLKVGVPTGVYATDGTSSAGVTVSWNAVSGAEGYVVYRGTTGDPLAAEVLVATNATTIVDTTAEPGTLYYYWVAATNAVSESEKGGYDTGYSLLSAPTGVAATTTSGAAAVSVTWQPVSGALFYRVYRGTRSGEGYAVEIDTTTETSYADESAAADRSYYYAVKAVSASCESAFSAFVIGSR